MLDVRVREIDQRTQMALGSEAEVDRFDEFVGPSSIEGGGLGRGAVGRGGIGVSKSGGARGALRVLASVWRRLRRNQSEVRRV